MDAGALGRAVELLGQFNDELTHLIDASFGTHWAEIEEMVALVALAAEGAVSTRRLSDVSGLHRRAVTRLVTRLCTRGLVVTRRSAADGRVVEVVLTRTGQRRANALRSSSAHFFVRRRSLAAEISAGMQANGSARLPPAPGDALDLLRRVCDEGALLVRFMPEAATHGLLAARQRAALVMVVMQGRVRPSELAPLLEVSRAGAAYIVDQLCAKGFTTRLRGVVPEDRRAVVLVPTAEGIQAVAAVMQGIEHRREPIAELFAEVAAWRPADRGQKT
ncbi:MarR family transcriptional regulator [Terrabacter sp. NPDC000476]|uniref:MarR family winged helix-turn-helix transcriptional regulator n=1 Tax=Terrabacter sp. NPDC000476 TaxID=3154258 RepID=UPI00332FF7B7